MVTPGSACLPKMTYLDISKQRERATNSIKNPGQLMVRQRNPSKLSYNLE